MSPEPTAQPIRASLRTVDDHGVTYTALMFVCPGCAAPYQIVEDHIRDLRCENAQLRGDLAAAYCRMDDMEGYNDD